MPLTIRSTVSSGGGSPSRLRVGAGKATVNTTPPFLARGPLIIGVPALGNVLTADDGDWNGAVSITRVWKRDGVPIVGETGVHYTFAVADFETLLTITVTATNAVGSTSATSPADGPVPPPAPTIVTPPSIAGTAEVGLPLTCTPGVWTYTPTITRTWKHGDGSAAAGAPVGLVYTPLAGDAGFTMVVHEHAVNPGGTGDADSAATAAVWTPSVLGFDVYADTTVGLFKNANGTVPPTINGDVVNSWTNAGALGGLLAKLTDENGPFYRPNSGVPWVQFGHSGSNGYALGLDVSSGNSGNLTIHQLVKHLRSDVTLAKTNRYSFCLAGTGHNNSGLLASDMISQTVNYCSGVDTNDAPDFANVVHPGDVVTDDGWHICSWRRVAGSPSTWTAWVDGQQVWQGTTPNTAVISRFNCGGPMYGEGFTGGMAIALFKRTVADSDANILRVQAYFLRQHALLPSPAKLVAWVGDSTGTVLNAYDNSAPGTWLLQRGLVYQVGSYLQSNNGLGPYLNWSVGGYTTQQLTDAAKVAVAGWLSRASAKRVMVIGCGANDIRAGGAGLTPAQSYAKMVALITAVRGLATGRVEVVVKTLCDADPTFYPGFTALRNTLNGLIVAGAGANDHLVSRVDLAAVGATGAYAAQPTWFVTGDGYHRVALGMDQEAAVDRAAIAAAL